MSRVRPTVANPPALAAGRRYLEVDTNRTVPGDPASPDRERLQPDVSASDD